MDGETKYILRNPTVKVRNEAFGRLLVASGLPMLCINKDAALIWDLCNGERTLMGIVDACKSELAEMDGEAIKKSVNDFIGEALRLGLVTQETK